MNQGLQGAAFLRSGRRERGVGREQPGQKMMLVGKSRHPQATEFCLLGQAGPLDMSGEVTLPDSFQDRGQDPVIGITLQRPGA
ncbi:MAG: hypothetical protein ABIU29_11925, partial [Chthoniobacterales bacterium]